jgi:hypothetical protein
MCAAVANCSGSQPQTKRTSRLIRKILSSAISLCAASVLLFSTSAKADLLGSTVTGSITPGDLNVVTQFSSPVTVGSGDFTGVLYDPSFGGTYDLTADFTATGLILSVTSPNATSNVRGHTQYTLTFSDAAFGPTFDLVSLGCNSTNSACSLYTLPNFLSSDVVSGSTVTLTFDGIAAGDVYTFQSVTPSATPEPSSLALLGTGLLAGVGALRRRISC